VPEEKIDEWVLWMCFLIVEWGLDILGIRRRYPECVSCGENATVFKDNGDAYCEDCDDEMINLYILRDPKGKP